MQIEIKNYRGISSAVLDMDRICLVAGANEAGKTSTAQAVAAALTGEPIPIAGVKKTQGGFLVRSGAACGSIDMTTDKGSVNVTWPTAKVKTEGSAPFASHFAAGLVSIATVDEKERPKILAEYLSAAPTRADLDAQLKPLNLPAPVINQLWELIEKIGWDSAHAQIKEKGATLKGQWQGVTGEAYGSKKAESWLPDGWEQDLMGQSEVTLKAFVTDANDALEATIATDAVDENRMEGYRLLADLLAERSAALVEAEALTLDPAMKQQVVEVTEFIASINGHIEEYKASMRDLPSPNNPFNLPCPACGVALELTQGKSLSVASLITPEEVDSRQSKIDELQGRITAATDGLHKHMASKAGIETLIKNFDNTKAANVNEAKRLIEESKRAAAQLAAAKPPGAKADVSHVEQCRNTLASASSRLQAFVQKNNADKAHTAIGLNQELIAKIAPEGIRADVLAKALKGFNEKTVPFCKAASWRPVTLETDFSSSYGGTPYLLLSESAKFRVRTILGLTMALMDRSEAVIVDAADILDKGGRNGLFKAIKAAGLPALVCMTMDGKDLVPNLGKANMGASYWIEDSVAVAI